MMTQPRGFALLVAILLATIAVTLGVSLIDIAYKQVVLASTAKQSQFGFYASDSAMECALYWDQKFNAFDYGAPRSTGTMTCNGLSLSGPTSVQVSGATPHRRTEFEVRCQPSGTNARVSVYKYITGSTTIYANGYSSCNASDQRRVERGLKVFY